MTSRSPQNLSHLVTLCMAMGLFSACEKSGQSAEDEDAADGGASAGGSSDGGSGAGAGSGAGGKSAGSSGGSDGESSSGGESNSGGESSSGGTDGSGGQSDLGGQPAMGGSSESGGATAAGGSSGSCEGKGFLLCEDFENATLGGTPEDWTKRGEESAVADDQANSGTQSLRLGAIPEWERRISHDASMVGSSHWGRLYYRVQLPVPDEFVHSTLVAFVGVGPNIGEAEYRVVDTVKAASDAEGIENKHQFLYNVQPQGDEFGDGTSYNWFFEDEWHCAEWHIDSADQSYAFYYDGEEVLGFARGAGNFEDAEIPESFSEVRIGWINYQVVTEGFTAWVDDFALNDTRIGCDL